MRVGGRLVGLIALSALVAFGCGESEHDDPHPSTSGRGGVAGAAAGGTGGTTSEAGNGGAGGSAGANASAGRSGSAAGTDAAGAAGGTAADAGESGAPNAGRSGAGGAAAGMSGSGGGSSRALLEPDAVARAAMVLGSCHPDDGVSRLAHYLWSGNEGTRFWDSYYVQVDCLATAGGGCEAMSTCLGWSLAPAPDCAPGCAGDVFTNCFEDSDYEFRLDCSTLELECDERTVCSNDHDECDPETTEPFCDDSGRPSDCASDGFYDAGPVCESLGVSCEAGACVGSGDACEANTWGSLVRGLACSGDTLESCVGGRKHDFDCKHYGPDFSCQVVDSQAFCGIAAECVPAELGDGVPQNGIPEPACDGTTLVFCNAGRLERIDCAALGFTGCDVEDALGCVPSPTSEYEP